MSITQFFNLLKAWINTHGLEIIVVGLGVFFGIYISLKLSKLIEQALLKKDVDRAVSSLIRKLIFYSLSILMLIAGLNRLGVNTASLLTVIGAIGLAVGLALKDSFSHFASGILIVLFRPFTIGDYIKVDEFEGFVEDIGIFHTRLNTLDNASIIIPNSSITNNTLVNFTRENKRRVLLTFGISYKDDIKKAREIIMNLMENNSNILKDPAPSVVVSGLGDNSVNLQVRAWVKTDDYWDVYFYLIENIKIAFDENGITIPYPQLDVHLNKG